MCVTITRPAVNLGPDKKWPRLAGVHLGKTLRICHIRRKEQLVTSTMTKTRPPKVKKKARRLHLHGAAKTDVRTQFAALCYRYKRDELQICLITSRGTGRWIPPKGWPMHKQTPADAAATEAWEEAGLTGKVFDTCIGVYSYNKPVKDRELPIMSLVYPIRVKSIHTDWPEKSQRKRKS